MNERFTFVRLTERARRIFFLTRYEANLFGSTTIETEHLLLAVIRIDARPPGSVFPDPSVGQAIRREVEKRRPVLGKIKVAVGLPLSDECKRIFEYSAEEADRLQHRKIGVGHLVIGILREEKCAAAKTLNNHGLRLDDMRVRLSLISQDAHQ